MIFSISEAMDIPLRDRNQLMLAAGFAPKYKESDLDSPELERVRTAVDRILDAHLPYPAIVFDRMHNILRANTPAQKLQGFLYGVSKADDLPPVAGNLVRGLLHADGYKAHVKNWDIVASIMLRRLRAEALGAVNSLALSEFYNEVSNYPDLPPDWACLGSDEWRQPMLTIEFEKDGLNLSLFSTLTALGAPFDITLQEIRIESYFPVDQQTSDFFSH